MRSNQHQRHQSFLLRLWRTSSVHSSEWCMSLEDAQTHERHGFGQLEELAAFLEATIERSRPPIQTYSLAAIEERST